MSGSSNLHVLGSTPLFPARITEHILLRKCQPAVLRNGKMATSLVVLDLDGVLKDTVSYEAAHYWPKLNAIAERLGLDPDLVLESHKPKMKRRIRGIEYLISECAAEQELKIDQEVLLEAVHEFNALVGKPQISSCPGVAQTLANHLERFPQTAVIVYTQCLDWMVPRRLSGGDTNLLPYIDGVVCVAPLPARKSTFHHQRCVLASTHWLEDLYAEAEETCQHFFLELCLPYEQTKPQRYGLDWAAGMLRISPQRAVFVGNEAIDQQCAIAAGWPNFVWARYGASPDANMLEPPAHIIDAFNELPDTLEKLGF